MMKKEIESKFDQIVDFGGVEKFINTPVKRYSSGMQVRLGFAIAAHLEPDILIVDEVLAVGDVEFQRKCIGKMEKVVESGRTVLVVSHNLATLQALCSRAIVLDQGRIIYTGETQEAIGVYLRSFNTPSPEVKLAHVKRDDRYQSVITKLDFLDQTGQSSSQIGAGTPLTVIIHYRHSEPLRSPFFSLTFTTTTGINVFFVQNHIQSLDIQDIDAQGVVTCHIPQVPLVPGKYYITCECGARARLLDRIPRAAAIEVVERDVYGTGQIPNDSEALVLVDATWCLKANTGQLAAQ